MAVDSDGEAGTGERRAPGGIRPARRRAWLAFDHHEGAEPLPRRHGGAHLDPASADAPLPCVRGKRRNGRRVILHHRPRPPEIRYAWRGPPELLTGNRGRAGTEPLSACFFRETRYLPTLRLKFDGDEPSRVGWTACGWSWCTRLGRTRHAGQAVGHHHPALQQGEDAEWRDAAADSPHLRVGASAEGILRAMEGWSGTCTSAGPASC